MLLHILLSQAHAASPSPFPPYSGIRLEWINSVQMVSKSAIGKDNVFQVNYTEPGRRRASMVEEPAEYTLYIQIPIGGTRVQS